MKKIISALLISLVANSALALSYTQAGHGTCREWNKERKEKISLVQETWLSGYLTGLQSTGYGGKFLDGSDDAAIFGWMDRYCKANPAKKMDAGVFKLVKKLKSNAPNSN